MKFHVRYDPDLGGPNPLVTFSFVFWAGGNPLCVKIYSNANLNLAYCFTSLFSSSRTLVKNYYITLVFSVKILLHN